MLNIRAKLEAQAVWQRFHEKYANEQLAPGLSLEQKARYEKRLSPAAAKEYEAKLEQRLAAETNNASNRSSVNDSAILLQKRWKGLRARDTHVFVNPTGNHSGVFKHLLHGQKIKKSLNKQKLDSLKNALDCGNWTDPIFKDKELPFLALSLFSSGKILQQQAYTVFEFSQTLKHYNLESCQAILDTNGQFTEAAKKYVLPILKNRKYLKKMSDQQIEEFRLLVSALPPSEQIFYITAVRQKNGRSFSESIGERLVQLDAMNLEAGALVHLPSGVRDSAGLARFGFDGFVRAMPRFGKLTIDEIEHGVRNDARYAALAYSEPQNNRVLHNWDEVNDTEAEVHDHYHSQVMSLLSLSAHPTKTKRGLRAAFLYFIDLTRPLIKDDLQSKWSKEIWDWVDGDYIYLFHKAKFRHNQDITELLCASLLYGTSGNIAKNIDSGGGILQASRQGWGLSAIGANIIIDMVKNASNWEKIGINPQNLVGDFKDNYNDAKAISAYLQDGPHKLRILKLQVYQLLKKRGKSDFFAFFSDLINRGERLLLSDALKFKKIKKRDLRIWEDSDLANTLQLFYQEIEIFPRSDKTKGLLEKILEDSYLALNSSASKAEGVHFRKAILELECNENEANHYMQDIKNGASPAQARFKLRPSVFNWLRMNPLKSIFLGCTLIGLCALLPYANSQAKKQQHENQNQSSSSPPTAGGTLAIALQLEGTISPKIQIVKTVVEEKQGQSLHSNVDSGEKHCQDRSRENMSPR